jgi:phospholipid N-methyltransferase
MSKAPPSIRDKPAQVGARAQPRLHGQKPFASGAEPEGGGSPPTQGAPRRIPAFYRYLLFAGNFLRHPRALGMILPSSGFLVRRTLAEVPWDNCRVLVEYGPGVGHFTTEILRRMRPDATLVGIEINPDFVRYLRDNYRDPRLRVMEGSAVDVQGILRRAGCLRADCVVAGIPFSTMPPELRDRIVRETHSALADDGTLVVYQLSSTVLPHLRSVFRQVRREFEPLNLLPTQLFRCTK